MTATEAHLKRGDCFRCTEAPGEVHIVVGDASHRILEQLDDKQLWLTTVVIKPLLFGPPRSWSGDTDVEIVSRGVDTPRDLFGADGLARIAASESKQYWMETYGTQFVDAEWQDSEGNPEERLNFGSKEAMAWALRRPAVKLFV